MTMIRSWTPSEDNRLMTLRQRNFTVSEAAKALNRLEQSVIRRAIALQQPWPEQPTPAVSGQEN
jgi:hypothetical protein